MFRTLNLFLYITSHFQDFARQAEVIFKGSVRRTDLDKAYVKLVTCLFDQIGRVASESVKTPREVVHFGRFPI